MSVDGKTVLELGWDGFETHVGNGLREREGSDGQVSVTGLSFKSSHGLRVYEAVIDGTKMIIVESKKPNGETYAENIGWTYGGEALFDVDLAIPENLFDDFVASSDYGDLDITQGVYGGWKEERGSDFFDPFIFTQQLIIAHDMGALTVHFAQMYEIDRLNSTSP